MKRWLKYLFVLALTTLSGWVIWLYLTATPAPLHPYFANSGFETIAHRGGAGYMPENTLAAFFHSNQLGADVLEMDLRLTKDHRIVVIHDKALNRTTDCEGFVSQYNLSELQNCVVKEKPLSVQQNGQLGNPQSKNIKATIPTLREVFHYFPSKRLIVEIKDNDPTLITNFCNLIMQFNKQSQVLVGSFRQSIMDQFRKDCPEVATSATPKESFQFFLLSKLRLTTLLSPIATTLQMPWRFSPGEKNKFLFFDILSPSLVQQAHQKNLTIQVWTVNETQEMETLIKMGVDGIMTDYPDKLIKVVKANLP